MTIYIIIGSPWLFLTMMHLQPLALITKVGATYDAFPDSFAFRARGPRMVWNSHPQDSSRVLGR